MGLFLSLALAAALVESKSTSEARIRVLIESANDPIERAAGCPTAQEECMWGQRVSITLAFFKAASGMPVAESQHTLMLCSKMGLHGWGTAIAKAELQATGTAGGSLYCTRRSARIRLRDQIENEDSRSCRSTCAA